MENLLASIINNGLEINKNLDDYIINKTTNEKIYLKNYQKLSSHFFLQNNINSFFLYWEPGFGKTLASIYIIKNLTNVWPNWNYVIIVKSQLIKDPWLKNIDLFIPELRNNIMFISYDQKILSADDIINKLKILNSNNRTIFVIDEIHNLIKQVIEKDDKEKRLVKKNFFDRLIQIIKKGKNKLLLLTATPIHNSNDELNYFLKLLRPNNFKIDNIYFKNDLIIDRDELKKCLLGASSVQKNNDVDILTDTNYKNDLAGRRIIFNNLLMSEFQTKEYNIMHNIEINSKIKGLRPFTRAISTLAIPILKSNFETIDEYKTYLDKEYNNFIISIMNIELDDDDINDFKNGNLEGCNIDILKNLNISTYNKPKNKDLINKITILNNYSCKYIKICHSILNTNGKCLLYESFVKFIGIKTLKPYLEKFKISFLEYSGNTLENRTKFIEMFNSKDNINGDIIKVLIFSSAGEEGINFMYIKRLIISSIPWSGSKLEQIIGRAIRLYSHKDLPEDQRIVYIDILLAFTNDMKYSVDNDILNLIKKKENSRSDVFQIFKESSIDVIHQNFPYEEPQTDELFFNFTNIKYILKKKNFIIKYREFKKILYSFDNSFLNIYNGLLYKNEVYSEDMVYIGDLKYVNEKPVIKILNNKIVYLINNKIDIIKQINTIFDDIEIENNLIINRNKKKIESLQDFGIEIDQE